MPATRNCLANFAKETAVARGIRGTNKAGDNPQRIYVPKMRVDNGTKRNSSMRITTHFSTFQERIYFLGGFPCSYTKRLMLEKLSAMGSVFCMVDFCARGVYKELC